MKLYNIIIHGEKINENLMGDLWLLVYLTKTLSYIVTECVFEIASCVVTFLGSHRALIGYRVAVTI
jgi:hypothetical protein